MYSSFLQILVSNMGNLISNSVSIAIFVLGAVGAYQLARARGYDKPWLACIPVVNGWIIGWICDDIFRLRGKRTGYRKLLLGLNIALSTAFIPLMLYAFTLLFRTFGMYRQHGRYNGDMQLSLILGLSALSMCILAAAVCKIVFTIKACYCIFQDYAPENAVLFTVLSCFMNLYHIFFFVVRKRPSSTLYWAGRPRYTPPFNGYPPGGTAPRPPYPPQGYYAAPSYQPPAQAAYPTYPPAAPPPPEGPKPPCGPGTPG